MRRWCVLYVLLVGLLLFTDPSLAGGRPPELADFRSLVSVSDAQISPDGSNVAYVQTVRNFAKTRNDDSLMLVAASGGSPRLLAVGHYSISSPRWSHDGQMIAYLGKDKKDKDQVFALSLGAGKREQVTSAKDDVEQFAWSPNGKQIAYVTQDQPADPSAEARSGNLFDVHDDGYRTDSEPLSSHIWVTSLGEHDARRLTSGSWSVLEALPPFVGAPSDPSWSPDGRRIVFVKQANADNADSDETTIAAVDVKTGQISKIGSHPTYEYQAIFSPDRDEVAYLAPHGPGPISVLNAFVVTPSAETNDTAALDQDVTQVMFEPKTGALLMMASDQATNALWRKPLGAAPQRFDPQGLVPTSFSVANDGTIAMIASQPNRPSEVYAMRTPSSPPKRLTFANQPFEQFAYGRSDEITWTAPDGERSDGVLTYPINYVAGKTYPLVLRIHGGPESATTQEFETLRQLLAARGYLVFEPNYRGSDNLGTAHEHAIYRDPGAGPGNDVMSGIAAVERLGIVDASRIAVTGHSYGGFMTCWLIGHEHIWKAAVIGDGMVDWLQEYNLSATGNLAWTRDSLGGTPTDASSSELYRTGSPITYVGQIATPTLIISGTSDEQVPISESYSLYHALHDEGVPVRFVAIPDALHFPTNPAQVEGYYRVTLEWLERYLR